MQFPSERFRRYTIEAFFAEDDGDVDRSRRFARCALAATRVEHSGFSYHPNVGLVGPVDEDVIARLVRLAGPFDVQLPADGDEVRGVHPAETDCVHIFVTPSMCEKIEEYDAAAAPLLAELAAAGYPISDVSELKGSTERYRDALPILKNWLPRITHRALWASVVAALGVTWARKEVAQTLIDEFRRIAGSSELDAWQLGHQIGRTAHDGVWDDLCEIVSETAYGTDREMIVYAAFGRTKRRAEAKEILIGLLDDPDVYFHALSALRRMRAVVPRETLERFIQNEHANVRKCAKGYLEILDRES